VSTPREGRASARARVEIQKDLASLLAHDQAVYLRLGPEGAVLSVKSNDRRFAFGDAIEGRWRRLAPDERARAVLGWIRKAAAYSRKPRVRWVPA
jgi:hypothetical protein